MKKFLKGSFYIACCCFATCFSANAQYVLKAADKQYELFNYSKAIQLYAEAFKKKQSVYAAERLANAYALTNNYQQAENWFATAVKLANGKAENVYGYAKALQNNAKYAEAKTQYMAYIDKKKDITEKQKLLWLTACDSALFWMKNPKPLEINNLKNLNSPQSDWGAVNYADGIVFTSDRIDKETHPAKDTKPFLKFDGAQLPDKNIYGWTGNGYLKLYFKANSADSVLRFALKTNTAYHVGSASFTADGSTVYYTLTKIPERLERNKQAINTVNVEIYSSTKTADGNWTEPKSFAFNKVNDYSLGDPFIAPDGKTLYFVSNMPGGKGGTDIYYTKKNAAGEWDKPINLTDINTEGNERNPFACDNGDFYFASDGHIGMGGLDIFTAKLSNNSISQIQNMGYPFNSPQDDFSPYLFDQNNKIYFASNRQGGLGNDDVYATTLKQPLVFKLTGTVFDKTNNQSLADATVNICVTGTDTLKVQTNQQGNYQFDLAENTSYRVMAQKNNYRAESVALSTSGLNSSKTFVQNLYLDKIVINKAIKLENIYYDFNKSDIRADAAMELDKLAQVMQDNPNIVIEVDSHTDSQGKDAYNLALSQRRADAVVNYLTAKGIAKNRMIAKGFGETRLLNRCKNGVKCTEAEQQINRRTEYKIIKQ